MREEREHDTGAAPGRRAPAKSGEVLAQRIQREIAAAGWPVGERIGTETELLQRYRVSRPVLREAVRLLETNTGPYARLHSKSFALVDAEAAIARLEGSDGEPPAVHVSIDEAETQKLQAQWLEQNIEIPLRVIESPYREVALPLIKYIRSRREEHGAEVVTIYTPLFIVGHWWRPCW